MAIWFGGDSGIRTPDLWIMIKETLYKLLFLKDFILVSSKVYSDFLLSFGPSTPTNYAT